ncbi:L-threonylcarbamoyladenylate synthase [Crenobacter luteus]|uniref:Threonylcarbamoyl-AMP synthase n=1 Tax=Crenobacter luteus TaxID=1452487 RepID=A0A165FH96_9NEIS|nr:L-threonylcarbamoyladenylate synthase [Crenobacter luteus]KZE33265.1 tRNA threonylcarbamoyladenosine biosynthesis protein RimN [Crenobacter luteus]
MRFLRQLPRTALLRRARARLKAGGVIAYPTESCYGLGCNPLDARALRRVIALKGRPNHKGLIVIAASLEQLRPLVAPLSADDEARLMARWPGPVTFLLPASRRVLPLLRGRHKTLAVRIPDHDGARHLAAALGPLVSTSANPAGQVSLKSARACRATFGERLLTLPGRVGGRRSPSTIIDFASGRVLR